MADGLQTPLQYLKGVGPRRAADLQRAGLHTVEDLLFRFPRRYEDRSRFHPIAELRSGMTAALQGRVLQASLTTTRRPGFRLFTALVQDASGPIQAVWPNQAFLKDVIRKGQELVLFGKVEEWGTRGLQLTNPEFEALADEGADGLHTGRIVPVYERAGSVTPNIQRRLVYQTLEQLPPDLEDPIPAATLDREGWPSRAAALRDAHFPPLATPVEQLNRFSTPAQQRLIYEEFFVFHAGLALRRHQHAQVRKAHVPVVTDRIREAARAMLPFKLTAGQRSALAEIVADMQRPSTMQRLLQGDVGAGKTIVALLAALVAMENGLQVAFMAPTEVLAEQHLRTMGRWLMSTRHRVELLTGRVSAARRRVLLAALARGDVSLVIGTHALLQERVEFAALGLVVIDEQHRFGVLQRAALAAKGLHPDVLIMTATPIPRTLALTACGDMELSAVRGLPPGRSPVVTLVKPETRREEVYALLRDELRAGRQAYVVYPLVSESEKVDLQAATEMAEELRVRFAEFRVELLHGRMKGDEKEGVMRAFADGAVQLLVTTTVIEVGVDVPNATIMLVEHAERFGLSQLHQLRGRVGRGAHRSVCVLLYQAPWSEDARLRLKAMADTTDGFVIAERDLELRGPGDAFGTRQSGLPQLRAGDLVRDAALIERAYADARRAVEAGTLPDATRRYVDAVWSRHFGLVEVG